MRPRARRWLARPPRRVRVARIAAAAGVVVLELSRHTDNLEELFFDLVRDRTLEVSPS